MDNYHLERFIKAQEEDYETALKVVKKEVIGFGIFFRN